MLDCLHDVYTITKMADLSFKWNSEKNDLLKARIGLCFEDVLVAIQSGELLDDRPHFNQEKYPHQRLLVVNIYDYACIIPYVIDEATSSIFLKTIYKSRKYTKIYLSQSIKS